MKYITNLLKLLTAFLRILGGGKRLLLPGLFVLSLTGCNWGREPLPADKVAEPIAAALAKSGDTQTLRGVLQDTNKAALQQVEAVQTANRLLHGEEAYIGLSVLFLLATIGCAYLHFRTQSQLFLLLTYLLSCGFTISVIVSILFASGLFA